MNLPGGIDTYFQLINDILASSLIIKSQNIFAEKRTRTEGYLRANILFSDDSRLHFRELITTEPAVKRLSYTYTSEPPDLQSVLKEIESLID